MRLMDTEVRPDNQPTISTSGLVFSKNEADLLGRAVQQANSGAEKPLYTFQTQERSFSPGVPVLRTKEDQLVVRVTRADGARDFQEVWDIYEGLKSELQESK